MRIAWNRSDIDYTAADLIDRVVNGVSEIWTGQIRFIGGRAALVNVVKRADRTAVSALAVLEGQAFRPRAENELIFTAYAYQGGEVMGLDLATGAVRNYSNSPVYEEVEGLDERASSDAESSCSARPRSETRSGRTSTKA
jgi:hypothetical protein